MIYFMFLQPLWRPHCRHVFVVTLLVRHQQSIMLMSGLTEYDWDTVDHCSALRLLKAACSCYGFAVLLLPVEKKGGE